MLQDFVAGQTQIGIDFLVGDAQLIVASGFVLLGRLGLFTLVDNRKQFLPY